MKKLVFIALVLFGISNMSSQNGVFAYDYRHVPADEMEVFMANEAMYWSKIHAVLIKKGQLKAWSVQTRVGGLESEPNVYFYIGIGSLENLDNLYKVWPEAEKEVRSKMDKEKLVLIDERLKQKKFRVANVLFSRRSSVFTNNNDWNYLVHNYAKATDVDAFLDVQDKYWKPFFEEHITKKNTKQVFWYSASVINPRGDGYKWNCYTVDAYKNMSDIYDSWNTDVDLPEEGWNETKKLMKNQYFYKRVIWRRVMFLDSEGNLIKNWD
ncbi:hypothetical protein [Tamlana flava]|uniref:hypothetical protein n=1 Tax=Tamlana flava TaxID=3158572 RepID=UPI00351AB3FD